MSEPKNSLFIVIIEKNSLIVTAFWMKKRKLYWRLRREVFVFQFRDNELDPQRVEGARKICLQMWRVFWKKQKIGVKNTFGRDSVDFLVGKKVVETNCEVMNLLLFSVFFCYCVTHRQMISWQHAINASCITSGERDGDVSSSLFPSLRSDLTPRPCESEKRGGGWGRRHGWTPISCYYIRLGEMAHGSTDNENKRGQPPTS